MTLAAATPSQHDARDFGFSPTANGIDNTRALQSAVDRGGTVTVTQPGTYDVTGTVYIGSHTCLTFGAGVILRKQGVFTHVLLNKGALTKTYDTGISIEGMHLQVNGVDKAMEQVCGLRGQIAFFYVKDLRISRFRCDDLMKAQFAIQVCTFEDLVVEDVIVRGLKDGVHLGRGKRFVIRRGIFQTHDDAVALNAHDYASGNPELGWIEDGIVEDCHDLAREQESTGFFCRILAGAWTDWRAGMEVQHSDTVVSHGRLYRVQAHPDGVVYKSLTPPVHTSGSAVLDGINWGVVQEDVTHTAGVRNVVLRDIFLHNHRTSFSIHFDNDKHSRSYYPGAPIPVQQQILLENVRVLHDAPLALLMINTPVDVVTLSNCCIGNNRVHLRTNKAMEDYGRTIVNMVGCIFTAAGETELLSNEVKGKAITLTTSGSSVLHDGFRAKIAAGTGRLTVRSDLPGMA